MFEDQQEQLKEAYQNLSARVQESSTFNTLSEKYSSLSPNFQKILLGAFVFLVLFLVLASPIASYKASVENMRAFEERKGLTQKVIDFAKKSKNLAPKPKSFNQSSLRNSVDNLAGSMSINLLPEQVSVSTVRVEKKLLKTAEQNDFKVNASKANIKQATNLAFSLRKSNKSLAITELEFKANSEDPAYFNSSIRLANLYVKPISEVLPKPETLLKGKKKKRKRGRR